MTAEPGSIVRLVQGVPNLVPTGHRGRRNLLQQPCAAT